MPKTSHHLELTNVERRAFFETGWIVRRDVFDADEIARMRRSFDALEHIADSMSETGLRAGSYFVLGTDRGCNVIKRVVWAGGSQQYLLSIGSDARLTVPSAQLLGSAAIDQLLCQAHFKRPFDGVTFGWHQDIEHRDKGAGTWRDVNGRGSFVQTVVVLDPMGPDSGPLKFVERSAQWGRIAFTEDWYEREIARAGASGGTRHPIRTISAQPGDVLLFGPYAIHASFENRSGQPRRVLINGFASPGANRRNYPGAGVGRRIQAPVHIEVASARRGANRTARGRTSP
jgi:ectoine hydroxylase-related dioxygenase (phytanoyl-CoA dioxygenase family)